MPYNTISDNGFANWSNENTRQIVEMIAWNGAHAHAQKIVVMRGDNKLFTIRHLIYGERGNLIASDKYTCTEVDKLRHGLSLPAGFAVGTLNWSAVQTSYPAGFTTDRRTFHELVGLLYYFDDHAPKQIFIAERKGDVAECLSQTYMPNGEFIRADMYSMKAG